MQRIQVGDIEIGRPKKIAEILQNPEKKQLKNLPAQKNSIWPNFKPQK